MPILNEFYKKLLTNHENMVELNLLAKQENKRREATSAPGINQGINSSTYSTGEGEEGEEGVTEGGDSGSYFSSRPEWKKKRKDKGGTTDGNTKPSIKEAKIVNLLPLPLAGKRVVDRVRIAINELVDSYFAGEEGASEVLQDFMSETGTSMSLSDIAALYDRYDAYRRYQNTEQIESVLPILISAIQTYDPEITDEKMRKILDSDIWFTIWVQSKLHPV